MFKRTNILTGQVGIKIRAIFPELSLIVGAISSLSCIDGFLSEEGQRDVSVIDLAGLYISGEDCGFDFLEVLLAPGALKISKFLNSDLGVRIAQGQP